MELGGARGKETRWTLDKNNNGMVSKGRKEKTRKTKNPMGRQHKETSWSKVDEKGTR